MTQTTDRLTLKGAKNIKELRTAIAQRIAGALYHAPEYGAVLSGIKANGSDPARPLRLFKGEGNMAFQRSNGKSVYVLRSNCFNDSMKNITEKVKEMFAACKTQEELFDAFTSFLNEATYEANVWSDNPNLATILQGASIQGTIKLDEWVDEATGEARSKVVLDSIKDITIRVAARGADADLAEELFAMADDTVEEPAKPTGKSAPKKAGAKA